MGDLKARALEALTEQEAIDAASMASRAAALRNELADRVAVVTAGAVVIEDPQADVQAEHGEAGDVSVSFAAPGEDDAVFSLPPNGGAGLLFTVGGRTVEVTTLAQVGAAFRAGGAAADLSAVEEARHG